MCDACGQGWGMEGVNDRIIIIIIIYLSTHPTLFFICFVLIKMSLSTN